ncbi:MAG: Jag N-terminal domain-containing protein [Desulfobulbaceae bacterium]|nr:Jag N-terminal domain-containing protein [Desulfobulbaceae bacterium]
MAKGKDFYGNEVTTVIEEACREFGVSQEELDIEVLETGSAGIFGLCKKKAHIRAQKKKIGAGHGKKQEQQKPAREEKVVPKKKEKKAAAPKKEKEEPAEQPQEEKIPAAAEKKEQKPQAEKEAGRGQKRKALQEPVEPPSEEILALVQEDINRLLELMGCPSEVALTLEDSTLNCHLSGEHEEELVGTDGRTLDSLQYLLRKMMSRRLPDRMMLALDAGDFRQRRAEELKERALELAGEVKENGKTQAIPALNPAERRVVHMILQEDKAIRSRSVGEGLFKKVLIYKPGKGSKSTSRKRRGRSGGRSSEN